MVLKPADLTKAMERRFESSVNSDGTQTNSIESDTIKEFESSVNSDGTQTVPKAQATAETFESSVNSDGTQTH